MLLSTFTFLQLVAHTQQSLKHFPTVMIIFWGFQYFLLYLEKFLWSILSSPNLSFLVEAM